MNPRVGAGSIIRGWVVRGQSIWPNLFDTYLRSTWSVSYLNILFYQRLTITDNLRVKNRKTN